MIKHEQELLNDYIHILRAHDSSEISKVLDKCECNLYSRRTRQDTRRRALIEQEYFARLLGDIHCYLYHNFYRENDKMDEINIMEEEKSMDIPGDDDEETKYDDSTSDDNNELLFGFGSFIYYNLLQPSPRHQSLKEEMLSHIKVKEWDNIYEESIRLLNTYHAATFISREDHNNILTVQPMQIGDILAIKFYTDLTDQQKSFRQSFLSTSATDTDTDIIKRHVSDYYFWGKWLNHAITVYGEKINNDEDTYYHGLSKKLVFSSMGRDFNIPTSVTTDRGVAGMKFAGRNGIILQIKCKYDYNSKWNKSKALLVDWISAFPREKETLLFGNFNELKIENIYVMDDFDNNKQHKTLIQAMGKFEHMVNGFNINEKQKTKNATVLYQLMKNELEKSEMDYFGEIFHRICEERVFYGITAFRKYIDKYWTNDLGINSLNLPELKCTKCDKAMLDISRTHLEVNKCYQCGHESVYYCDNNHCNWFWDADGFCSDCGGVIQLFQHLMPNASYEKSPDIKNRFNRIKMAALKIESLQKYGLM